MSIANWLLLVGGCLLLVGFGGGAVLITKAISNMQNKANRSFDDITDRHLQYMKYMVIPVLCLILGSILCILGWIKWVPEVV